MATNTRQIPSTSSHRQKLTQSQSRYPTLSTHKFRQNIDWWLGCTKHNNCKIRRYKLIHFLFPHTSSEERGEYYEPDGKGGYLPEIRYDRVSARKH